MGGFVDPFVPAPAWPQDVVFTGSSWSSSASSLANSAGAYGGATPAQDIEFDLRNGSTPAFLHGSDKETVSPVELHEELLRAQLQDDVTHGLNFEVDSAVECALMAGTLGSVLSTPCVISLADSVPVVRSSNDSSGSEQSGLPQFLLGEQSMPTPAAWTSTFAQISSLVGEETSQSFGFGTVSNDDLQHEACAADGKKYPQLGNVPSAPLQLHELSGLHHLNLSSLVSGQLSSFNATGAAYSPKQSNEVSSGMNGMTAPFITRSEVPNGNGTAGNGAPKPRVRARRGQATDPHSIAERLRREKISDRMKNLQELVPNPNKTDKASMLDEIIDYVKFLQLQVKVLSMSRLGATEAIVPLLTESQTESKGLCLMPIALASAISDQKGTSSAAVRLENGSASDDGAGGCGSKGDVKNVLDALKPFGSAKEMKSRA